MRLHERFGRRSARRAGVLACDLFAVVALGYGGAAAATPVTPVEAANVEQELDTPTFDAPVIALNRYTFAIDEVMTVTVAGFTSRVVTISVCGNKALRGSGDCNMLASEGLGLDGDGRAKLARLPAATPPVPCPCVVRATNTTGSEVALAEVTLVGHPVADLVEAAGSDAPLAVTVDAERAANGLVASARSGLGGRTDYDVRVVVRNLSSESVSGVSITGHVGRSADDVITALDVDSPGLIEGGQTWEQTVRVTLPAPVFGDVEWHLAVAASGPTTTASDTSSNTPVLLALAVAFVVIDVVVLLARMVRRRRALTSSPPVDDRSWTPGVISGL